MRPVNAIVLVAGLGLRFKSKVSKSLIKINSCPLIIYCLNTLSRHPCINDIVVVVNSLNRKGIVAEISRYRIKKVKDIVLGGKKRQDSVLCGLKAIEKQRGLVLIHDGVRPFIDKNTVSAVIKEAESCGAAITGVPVKATIKEVHGSKCLPAGQAGMVHCKNVVEKTLNRENLWEIQTPQVFKKQLILEAYRKFGNAEVTDDASLVEKLGVKVKVVMGSYFNIKVTTPEDLIVAEVVAKYLMTNDKIQSTK